jgi:nitroimidazol reductase NimA-like FMN-containing flavoprotein (pyridoxamine 5'-phosphate oxidase superfamily)
MAVEEPAPGVAYLEAHQCWALLRSHEVGRLAVSIGDRPDIFPINYVVDHGTVVFRTAEGTKLAGAIKGEAVAFEADGYEPDSGEAWSVVVKGRAEEISGVHELLDNATDLPLFPWHAAPKKRFVRIVPDEISGRRFHIVDRDAWKTPLTDAPRASIE